VISAGADRFLILSGSVGQALDRPPYDPSFAGNSRSKLWPGIKPARVCPCSRTWHLRTPSPLGYRSPSECDIVLVIFWSRMGTPLSDEHCKPDGTPYHSGTEWEYFDALQGARVGISR
jgi:hypothetical protein